MIDVLLEISVVFLLLAMFFMGIHMKMLDKELDEKDEAIRGIRFEIEQLKAKAKVYEKRLIKMYEPDHIVIEHKYAENDAPNFGGF